MIDFIRDNQCSDEVLQYSFLIYAKSYHKDLMISVLGLAFTCLSFVLHILSFVCCPRLVRRCRGDDEACCENGCFEDVSCCEDGCCSCFQGDDDSEEEPPPKKKEKRKRRKSSSSDDRA